MELKSIMLVLSTFMIIFSCTEKQAKKELPNEITKTNPISSEHIKVDDQLNKESVFSSNDLPDEKIDQINSLCGILVKKDSTCLDCNKVCFLFKEESEGEVKFNKDLSDFFSSVLIDSCKSVVYENIIKTNMRLIEKAILLAYEKGYCSETDYSSDYFEERNIELLFSISANKEFLTGVSDKLLTYDESKGVLVLWKNFEKENFENYEAYFEKVLKEKNFFVLSGLYAISLINGYESDVDVLKLELEKQKNEFSGYYEKLMNATFEDLSFSDYYHLMYFE